MSLAKVHHVQRVRKVWTCGKCGDEIKVGQPAVKFAVGFRGHTQVRCSKPACFPKPSERESSLVSSAYAAQEDADLDGAASLEDLEQIRDDVASAVREVASEYEYSEMFEKNYDLQERADMLNSAADDLEGWAPEDDEPQEDDADSDTWTIAGTEYSDFDEAHEAWLSEARDSLNDAIDGMELP
jgi:hypothetical protein